MAIPPASFLRYDFSDPACYPGSGTSITDLSTNLDGTINDPSIFVSDGQQSYFNITTGSQRVYSNAYNFPVRNVYTISSIFKVSYKNDYNTLLSLAESDSSGTTPFYAVNFNSSEFNFPISSNAFGVNTITGNLKLQNNTWNLLTLTADGTTQKLYLNGILVGSVAHTLSFNGSNPRLQTGYPQTAQYFAIQKVAVMQMWSSALTAAQVKDLADSYATRFSLYQPVNSYDFSETESYPGSGTSVFDLAGSLTLPIVNAVYAGTGQSKYFSFDGNGDYIGTTAVTGLGDTFSVNIWYQPTAVNATVRNLWQVGVGATGTNPGVKLNDPSASDLTSTFNGIGQTQATGVLTANTWQMATVTADGSTHKIYIDGVLDASVSQGIGEWATGGFAIGAGVDGSGNISAGSDGLLGNVAVFDVYNSALGSTDITNIYNNQEPRFFDTPPGPVLIGSYDFSDPACYPGSGNTVFDLTAENNDLSITSTTFGGTGQSKYASFNGDTTYLYRSQFSASGSAFGGSDFTLSVWHNYNNPQSNNAIFIMGGNGAAASGIQLQVNGSDADKVTAAFGIEITESGQLVGIANTSNTWHMSTVTGDGSLLKLYQDGAFIGSTTQIGTWDGEGFIIGRGLGSSYQPSPVGPGFRYAGLIGIAEVYSGALGSTDISDLYDLQQPRFYPPPPPPAAATLKYDFSDPLCYSGTGDTIYDLSGYGLDATFTSGTASSFVGAGTSSYFHFDGTGWIRSETFANPTPTQFTMLAWASFDSAGPYGNIISAAESNVPGGVPLIAWSPFTTSKIASSNAYFQDTIENPSTSNINQWYMVTYTNDGTTLRLYVDDTEVGNLARTIAYISGTNPVVGIGQYAPVNDGTFIGKIAYAEFYAGIALTAGAISTIYNNEVSRFFPPPPYSGLVGGTMFAQGFNG
jgi:hypothetical protein